MKQTNKEREVQIDNKKRLEWNKIMNLWGISKKNKETIEGHPTKEDIMRFWKEIYEKEEKPDETEELIQEIMNNTEIADESWYLNLKDIELSLKYTPNWKTPGNDGIQGFWLKY